MEVVVGFDTSLQDKLRSKIIEYQSASDPADKSKLAADILKNNEALLHWVVGKFVPSRSPKYDDLYQIACLSLFNNLDSVDPDNCGFTNWLIWWMKSSIRIALMEDNTIRVPSSTQIKLNKYTKKLKHIVSETNEVPTAEELSLILDVRYSYAIRVLNNLRYPECSTVSIDNEITPEHVRCDKYTPIVKDSPFEYLHLLSNREQDIIIRRFKNNETLEMISEHYDITRERVRQLQNSALLKLRKHMDAYYESPDKKNKK